MAADDKSEETKEETKSAETEVKKEETKSEDHESSWTRMDAMIRKAVNEELGKWSPPAAKQNSSDSGQKESSDSSRKQPKGKGFLGSWF